MLKAKFIAVLLFAALFLAACAGQESSESKSAPNEAPVQGDLKDVAEVETSGDGRGSGSGTGIRTGTSQKSENGGGGGGRDEVEVFDNEEIVQNQVSLEGSEPTHAEPEKPIERKIIRDANLELESDAPEEAQQKITAIAEGKGGFVITSTQKSSSPKTGVRDTVTMSLRVPAEKFTEALDEIRKTGNRVIVETITGKDVTEEFIDIQARLKAKKALEQQFLEIMKQSKNVQEALNIQRELANVRGEIEVIEGRLRFLQNQASLSTINITIQTPTALSGNSEGFLYRLKESIGTGLNGALSFVLYFVTFLIAILPFLLLVVLPIFLILRYFWRKTKRKIKTSDAQKIVKEEINDE